ncbi:unnamed protein product [Oikopleura dioica]|uniref:Uncharacterized protein n=1 Tax=Oikopleura dioica TaxID=34765 RepID=E4XA34_OIKDI|nr:unnamed protein product [Oikopleura dioica]
MTSHNLPHFILDRMPGHLVQTCSASSPSHRRRHRQKRYSSCRKLRHPLNKLARSQSQPQLLH